MPKLLKESSVRKYLLLTFSHAECTSERSKLSAEIFISRLTGLFACKSIIVCKENHISRGGLHYHVGVWNENASKNTFVSKLREAFPEFEGRQLHVSPHKGWNTICKYLLKEDPNPTVWGEESLELLKDRAKSANTKSRGPDLVKLLRGKKTWEEVLSDDHLLKKCLSSYNSVRNTFEDLLSIRQQDCYYKMVRDFVESSKRNVDVYGFSDLNERYYVLFWLVRNLLFPRHLRQKQLLILGSPGTFKTSFVQCLAEFLPVYFVPRRTRDFSGANKKYAVWVIDEFSGYDLDLETLNMLLDGQRMRLDSKYGKVFEKVDNVPIIMLGNEIPHLYRTDSFRSRVLEISFFSKCSPLRLASTFLMLATRSYLVCPDDLKRTIPNYLNLKMTILNLSNSLGKVIKNGEAVEKSMANASLMSDLWVPFSLMASGAITFAVGERCLKKMRFFSNLEEKYVNLPTYYFCDLLPDGSLADDPNVGDANNQSNLTAVLDSVPSSASASASKEEGREASASASEEEGREASASEEEGREASASASEEELFQFSKSGESFF